MQQRTAGEMSGKPAKRLDGKRRIRQPPRIRREQNAVDMNVLRRDEFQQTEFAVRSAVTALLETAPRRLPNAVRVKNFVNANRSRENFFRDSFPST